MLLRYLVDALILVILSLFAVLFGGCMAGMGYTSLDRVKEATLDYNEGVRWEMLERAATHIPHAERQRFYEKHKNVEDDLEIADYEIVSLEVDKSDSKTTRAICRVQYTWSLKNVGLVQKTTTEQKWEETGHTWVMVKETRRKGSPLMLFDEPAAKADAK